MIIFNENEQQGDLEKKEGGSSIFIDHNQRATTQTEYIVHLCPMEP